MTRQLTTLADGLSEEELLIADIRVWQDQRLNSWDWKTTQVAISDLSDLSNKANKLFTRVIEHLT